MPAIITALTQEFYYDFLVFYDSVRRLSGYRLIVAPIDFDEHLMSHLGKLDIDIVDIPEVESQWMKSSFANRWIQWSKPYIIKRIIDDYKLEKCLWLDSDLVVLKPLDELFEYIDKEFLIIKDYFAPQSCLNDNELYERFGVNDTSNGVAINSGVVGMLLPRDNFILDGWLKNTKEVADDPTIKKYIKLYDQGVLLWAMIELDVLNKALPYKLWNNKAKKNCYEFDTASKKSSSPQHQWPWPNINRMGGDIIDELKLDNPESTIAHFAGVPKLSDLCELNNTKSVNYIRSKYGGPQHRLFVVGMERCGTHTVSEMLRRGVVRESWIRHEYYPVLAEEASLKWYGYEYWTRAFKHRMELFNRYDTYIISESNHRLGFFIPEICENVDNPKFLLMLRDPLAMLRSRFSSFSFWDGFRNKCSDDYMTEQEEVAEKFVRGSMDQNLYRIRPADDLSFDGWTPAQMIGWEIIETMNMTLRYLSDIKTNDYSIAWIDSPSSINDGIEKLIPNEVDWNKAGKVKDIKFGSSYKISDNLRKWIAHQIQEYQDEYIERFNDVLRQYNIIPPFTIYV